MALMLVLRCGSMQSAEFLKERLSDPSISKEERDTVLLMLRDIPGSGVPSSFYPVRVRVNAEVAQWAAQLARSFDVAERLAGASMLGQHDSALSRAELRRLCESDPEPTVRASALRALGNVGDTEILAFLRAYSDPRGPEVGGSVQQGLAEALRKLERRFPQ